MRTAQRELSSLLTSETPHRTATLESLEQLLRRELDHRREQRIERRLIDAHLPDRPTLEGFDFSFQPRLDKRQILDLAKLAWVERCEDLVLVGNAGTGKSHLAKAMCLVGCKQERRVLYTTCADMLMNLHASLADGSIKQRLKKYTTPSLLLIDDLGYDPLEQEQGREAQLLHKVLEARHGRASTIVTSNLDVEEWVQYLGHAKLTMALVDKLLYRAVAIKIDGPSYRLEEHKKRQASARKAKKPAES
jgi:DNA replication protein DnaC